MSNPQTRFAPTHTQSSSVLGEQIVGRSERQAVAPPAALKLRLDLNLEVEIAIQAKVNGDITLSLLVSYIGKYYSQFVPSEDVGCSRGKSFQTQEHIILECPRYEDQQEVLQNVSRSYLPDILGTKEGITALNEPIGTPKRSLRQGNHEV
ncbi:hypothetical protein EDD85DRAFT_1025816 [Armillaria nabsnona]|nr:hypothetical protein EDD85DRAFT_1025816 [Armillaria nabsnona]